MYFSLSFIILFLFIFPTTLLTLASTKLPRGSIIACEKNSQCPSATHFCNTQQNACISKQSVDSTCQNDYEYLTGKCYDQFCCQPCHKDKDCSHKKEYCSISNYCKAKHCDTCIRNAQCANHRCELFQCASNNCTTALHALQKHS